MKQGFSVHAECNDCLEIQCFYFSNNFVIGYMHPPYHRGPHSREGSTLYEEDAYIQHTRYLLLFQMVWLEELCLDDYSRNYILINWEALWMKTKTLKSTTINQKTLHRSAENSLDRIRNYIQ